MMSGKVSMRTDEEAGDRGHDVLDHPYCTPRASARSVVRGALRVERGAWSVERGARSVVRTAAPGRRALRSTLYALALRSWVRLLIDLLEPLDGCMGVDLRRRYRGVAEELLDRAQVGAGI